MLTPARDIYGLSSIPEYCNGFKESPKKVTSSNSSRTPLFSTCPNYMVKYGQKSTFDRKVVETPFFYQNDQNKILKIFPSV